MSLSEFQQFLLEYQGVCLGEGVRLQDGFIIGGLLHDFVFTRQELWAVDRLQVQEFMLSFLRDPLREIEEPYFFLDEVSLTFPTILLEKTGGVTRADLCSKSCVCILLPTLPVESRLSTLLYTYFHPKWQPRFTHFLLHIYPCSLSPSCSPKRTVCGTPSWMLYAQTP